LCYTPSAIRYSYFGTCATLPGHEGDERDEQRYKAVLAVIADGRTMGEVASAWGVCRQTMHRWLARYESDGLEGLGNPDRTGGVITRSGFMFDP